MANQRDGADQDAPATAPISQPAVTVPRARCTFTCVSSDEAAIEYVLMQSVDINDGETLTDVLLRLNDAHVDLCQLSGGEPAPEYTRECNPG